MKTIAILTLLALGCTGPTFETPQPEQVSDAAVIEDLAPPVDAGATPDAVEPDSLPPDAWLDLVPVTSDCSVSLLANVYAPGTDRLTAQFMGVDPGRIVVYLDGVPIDRGSWRLADDGHTLVVTQYQTGGHVVGFSLDCTVP